MQCCFSDPEIFLAFNSSCRGAPISLHAANLFLNGETKEVMVEAQIPMQWGGLWAATMARECSGKAHLAGEPLGKRAPKAGTAGKDLS